MLTHPYGAAILIKSFQEDQAFNYPLRHKKKK